LLPDLLWPYICRTGSRTRNFAAANHFGDDGYRARTLEASNEVEVWAELVGGNQAKLKCFALVTDKTVDLNEPNGIWRNSHPDIAGLFVTPKSTYWRSLVDLNKEVENFFVARRWRRTLPRPRLA
jgi:hypothetical protein